MSRSTGRLCFPVSTLSYWSSDWHMGYSHTHSISSTYIKSSKKDYAKYIFYLCFLTKFMQCVFSRCFSPRELATDWINRSLYCLKIQFNLYHPRQRKYSKKVTNENTAMVTSLVTPGTAACAGHAEPYQVCWFFLCFFFLIWKVVQMLPNYLSLLFLK